MGILKRIAATLIILAILSAPAWAQDQNYLYEQKIKAGLIYNFLKFTSWPEDALARSSGKLTVCLFGGDSFDGYLYPLEGKTAQQHVIAIIRVDDIKDTDRCNLIFIHRDESESLTRLFNFLKGKPVLTVSDINEFARQGGMVEMARENEHISLYINDKEARTEGIGIAGNILKLARHISADKRQP